MRLPTWRFLATCAVFACGVLGCGDGRKPVFPTRGTVMDASGKPLKGATITLHPVDAGDPSAPKPAGIVEPDGSFVLTTYTYRDGAPAGDYVATLELRPAPKSPADDPPDQLKGKFRDPKNSPFKLTVSKGENDLSPIRLP